MNTNNSSFKPNLLLQNRHIQTIYSELFRPKIDLDFTISEFTLSDGDFVEIYTLNTVHSFANTPTVILFHGLAGSYNSPYIQGMMLALYEAGFNSKLMHFRGCANRDNIKERAYHSGDTRDALEFIQATKNENPHSNIYTIGYSLGANMLLKLLGELGETSLIAKAIAVSPPMDLKACADKMNRGFSKIYQKRLLNELKDALDKKYTQFNMRKQLKLKREEIANLTSFWEYDEAYTAPIHGFKSAEDYYEQCSSKQYLKKIQTPTLIIHSQDDPFMTPEVIPSKEELSSSVTLELTQNGGHVGFVEGTPLKPKYWLEKRILSFYNIS